MNALWTGSVYLEPGSELQCKSQPNYTKIKNEDTPNNQYKLE